MTDPRSGLTAGDPFLNHYQPSELRVAAEFLSTWLPFLSKDLCQHCVRKLSHRIRSIDSSSSEASTSTESVISPLTPPVDMKLEERVCDDKSDDVHSSGGWKEGDDGDEAETRSIGSWKDGENEVSRTMLDASTSGSANESPVIQTPAPRLLWADMAQEDELEVDEEEEEEEQDVDKQELVFGSFPSRVSLTPKTQPKPELSREQREYIRFMNIQREKDFICFERIKGKPVNILKGLELHMGIFSAAEQKRIVDYVYVLQEMGKNGELKERTYTAPQKWMKGKGRETIQFGCCYNYATDKKGNPPGILYNELVDPLPHLFKVIIRRLVKWHVLPPTCVPDSCIVNIYEEGDCIPPHIDNHDFVRPFCTVSFLSECDILFGQSLKILGPGEFWGSHSISLPVGSVLVLNGNGADVARHCVPAVPTKRISITFRRMDESKRPINYQPEADLQDLQPLLFEGDNQTTSKQSQIDPQRQQIYRQVVRRENSSTEARRFSERGVIQSEPRTGARRFSERADIQSEPRAEARRFSERADIQSEPRTEARWFSERGDTQSRPRAEARRFLERGDIQSEPRTEARRFSERTDIQSEPRTEARRFSERGNIQSEPRNLNQNRQVFMDRRRIRVILGS